MPVISHLAALWTNLTRRNQREHDLDDEIRGTFELLVAEKIQTGLTPEEARRTAALELGGVEQVKEQVRDAKGGVLLESTLQDLRYAARTLRSSPGFTTVALLTLALGVGATTAIFSVANGVLLRPLPFRAPDRLMMIDEQWQPRFQHFEATPHDVLAWQEQNRSFENIAMFAPLALNLTDDNGPERISGVRTSWNLPSLLGVEPTLGRGFSAEEDHNGNHLVVLIGHDLWIRRFNASPAVIGQSVRLNGANFIIIGVMPPGFRFPHDAEMWRPMGLAPNDLTGSHFVWGLGRLRAGITPTQAQDEINRVQSARKQVWSANVYPLSDYYVGSVRPALRILLGAVTFVLLIACANVANLFLARGAARQKEVALRASLGATRSRILRQLVTESVLIGVIGGALGLALAAGGVRLFRQVAPASIPRMDEVTFDYRVLLFTFGVSALVGVLFGVAPALQLSKLNLHDGLKSGSKSMDASTNQRARRVLVISEIALALTLLVGAGLLTKSLWRLVQVDPGFEPRDVLAVNLFLPQVRYPEPERRTQFVAHLLDQIRLSPRVQEAAVSTGVPLISVADAGINFDGRAPEAPGSGTTAQYYVVTPGYLRTMRIPLIKGRFFTEHDSAGNQPVVVINETMARQFFANEDPIGKRLYGSGSTYLREIIGVVGDVKQEGVDTRSAPQVYEPFLQRPALAFTILVRTVGNPELMAGELRRHVGQVDRELPISQPRTMDEVVSRSLGPRQFSVLILTVFTILAVLLAAIGIYGLIAFTVAQRAHELAIRMAVGAQPRQILALVASESVRIVLIGLATGLAGSLALSRFLSSLLYDVTSTDPQVFALVSAGLVAVALTAALIPACRATRVDPVIALRYD
jgi:putative ABC transport system permease protein